MNPNRENHDREHPAREDALLDGCLEEILGGRTPPDLSARILQAWAAQAARGAASPALAGPLHASEPLPPPVQQAAAIAFTAPANGVQVRTTVPLRRKTSTWQTVALAGGVVGLALAAGGWGLWMSHEAVENPLAQRTIPPTGGKATGEKANGKSPARTANQKSQLPPASERALAGGPVRGADLDSAPDEPLTTTFPSAELPARPLPAPVERPYREPSPASEVIS
jgi:hypothetical protein